MNTFILLDGYFAGKKFSSEYSKKELIDNPYNTSITFNENNKFISFAGDFLFGYRFKEVTYETEFKEAKLSYTIGNETFAELISMINKSSLKPYGSNF